MTISLTHDQVKTILSKFQTILNDPTLLEELPAARSAATIASAQNQDYHNVHDYINQTEAFTSASHKMHKVLEDYDFPPTQQGFVMMMAAMLPYLADPAFTDIFQQMQTALMFKALET